MSGHLIMDNFHARRRVYNAGDSNLIGNSNLVANQAYDFRIPAVHWARL